MASYPTFDNRWFSTEVDDAKFDEIFPTETPRRSRSTPTVAAARQPGDPGPVQRGLDVQGVHGLRRPGHRAHQPEHDLRRPGHLPAQRRRRSTADRCAAGVRCEFRNSFCEVLNGPCRYGTINVLQSLAVSSDAFYYKLGEDFYLTPGTQLQDQVKQFGFGADTGIDLPFEFDGRVPTEELQAPADRVGRHLRGGGGPRSSRATSCCWPSARASWRRRRCSWPSGTRRSPTVARSCSPTSSRRSSNRRRPTASPASPT